jgi:hypothetical protein
MTVVTSALYERLAQRGEAPPLVAAPVEVPQVFARFFDLEDVPEEVLREVQPVAFREAAAEGLTGIPVLERHDFKDLIAEARREKRSEPEKAWPLRRTSWWEFRETVDERLAMFPGDNSPVPALATTQFVPRGRAVEVRRVDLGDRTSRWLSASAKAAAPRPRCGLDLEEDEEGAPYKGRCVNRGCPGDCSPHVVVFPDDGIYRLTGCDC